MVEKVWGCDVLPAPFSAPDGSRIGEIWFEPPEEMAEVLVKFLFTSQKLSVQVHPSQNDALPDEAGKDECWVVIAAQDEAKLAVGFKNEVTREEIERAAIDGSIEEMLVWHPAKEGDIFYLPAGTVHAIGPGLTLVEVQQTSSTTFRLYDYGRPRELHLERAVAVANGSPHKADLRSHVSERGERLIDGPFFRIDRIEGRPSETMLNSHDTPLLVLPLMGTVGANDRGTTIAPGECGLAPNLASLDFRDADCTLLVSSRKDA
ncbi:probable mannose-6-phosphate isomerase [Erythrobacter sp. NAP1]|uniref:class I mannose-6-phosphate isomerase n=1 Tax=Erythrobacter sp. NAP1 TaxID=237727 RepID=UPI00006878C8|nr:class I mannose-6-phosphate isomerase [Erythrobacter sp. NAP1]EAQ29032.1 probable mannose-6-phosphate isomerase [Erythrobacter sp. NAP1]